MLYIDFCIIVVLDELFIDKYKWILCIMFSIQCICVLQIKQKLYNKNRVIDFNYKFFGVEKNLYNIYYKSILVVMLEYCILLNYGLICLEEGKDYSCDEIN